MKNTKRGKMGFDVFGIEPKSEAGKYFRNNIWYWPRLWDFCCQITPEITESDQRSGHCNEGLIIKGEKHQALVRNLRKAINNKDQYEKLVKESEESHEKNGHWTSAIIEALKGIDGEAKVYPAKCEFRFDWNNAQGFLAFIEANNGFQIC